MDSGSDRRRTIVFAGGLSAEHDFAERGEEIMRTELGTRVIVLDTGPW